MSPEVTVRSYVWPSPVKGEWTGPLIIVGVQAETKGKIVYTSLFLGICEGEIIQPKMEVIVGDRVLPREHQDSLKEKG